MIEANYLISDFRFLLPLSPGQTVLVFGEVPELIEMIRSSAINCIHILDQNQGQSTSEQDQSFFWNANSSQSFIPLPFPDRSVDHILVPHANFKNPELVFQELARVLKLEGQIFFGLKTKKYWLYPLSRVINIWNTSSLDSLLTLETLKSKGRLNDFKILKTFGIYQSLKDPRYLIPLEDAGPAQYFIDHMLTPFTLQGRLHQRLVKFFSRWLSQDSMFQNIGLVLQRK